jgi:hypothetical protein
MPKLEPLPDWSGQDVFVIGGGRSLQSFDWSQLKDRNTIGCNQAFLLGGETCKICTFGDFKFWQTFEKKLAEFDGWVATNYKLPRPVPWVNY